jgi:preprotein translocase subunit YajC
LSSTILTFLAQVPTTAAQGPQEVRPDGGTPFIIQIIPFLLILVVLYFVMLRPNQTKEKKRTEMLTGLKRGDRVQTIGGILGTVVEAKETEIVLKVDESSNTKVRFTRSAIHRVVDEEKSETK